MAGIKFWEDTTPQTSQSRSADHFDLNMFHRYSTLLSTSHQTDPEEMLALIRIALQHWSVYLPTMITSHLPS
jgi:hypothetical protein